MSGHETVGFIGLGNMGLPMTSRLIEAGFDVVGFDQSEAALEQFVAAGGTAAASNAQVASNASLIILMLPNSEIVNTVINGEDGLATHLGPASLIVDMSSSEPMRTRALSEQLSAQNLTLIDAPVSGGVVGAKAGTLSIMVGGNETDVQRAQPALATLGRVSHVGDVGAGHTLKAINNLMSATHLWVTNEAMRTGMAMGLDPKVMLEVINRSSGRSGSTDHKWPNFIIDGTYDSGFSLALMLKDMKIARDLAATLGIPHDLSDRAIELWEAADEAFGRGADHTEVDRWITTHTNNTGEQTDD